MFSNKTIICLVIFIFSCSAFSYECCGYQTADSLLSSLKDKPDDTLKVGELAVMANKLASSNPKEAVKLAKHLIDLSIKINYEQGIAMGYNELGHAFERHSVDDSAFYYFFLSAGIFSRLNNLNGRATTLFNIGNLHEIRARYDSAAFYLYQSLQVADSINSTNLVAKNNRVIGLMMSKQNRLDEALQYYFSALRLFKIKNDLPELIARTQENIALLYIKKKNYTDAETYFNNALNIYTVNNEERGLARVHLNMATLRLAQEKYEEALTNNFYALDFYRKIEHPNGIAESLLQLAETYLKMKSYDNAINYVSQTLAVVQQNTDRDIELASYRLFQKIYFEKGNYKDAYYYMNKASELRDSIFTENKESIVAELQAKYKTEKKENEIRLLNKDKELSDAKIHRQEILRNSLIGGTILIIIIGLLLFNRFRISERHKHQAERMRISSDLHDEIGSTLSSISMYSEFAKEKPADAGNILNEISISSREMIDNMNDIIWAINPRNDSFENLVNRLRNYASRMTQSKNMELRFKTNERVKRNYLTMEQRKNIFLICKEAVNNAVKYSECKEVAVKIYQTGQSVLAEIRDDGKGFDIFSGNDYEGNGIKNMRLRAEQLGAEFSVKSGPNIGTIVKLEINPA